MIAWKGKFHWGRITRGPYLAGKQPVADVVLRDSGATYRAVRFLVPASSAGNFSLFLPQVTEVGTLPTEGDGCDVAVLFPEIVGVRHPQPWILASQLHDLDGERVQVVEEPPVATADYTQHHLTDTVLKKGTARLSLSEKGGVTLADSGPQPVRVQAAGGLRISVNGEAGETVLLGNAAIAYLEGLASQVESIRAALVRLENWASTATPAGSIASYALFPAPGNLAPVVSYPEPTGALKSAKVKLSSQAEE